MQDLTADFFGTGIVTRDPDSHPKACGFLHGVIRCTWKEGLTASPLLGHSCSCLEPEARVPHHPLRSAGDVLLSLRLQNQASLCGQAAAGEADGASQLDLGLLLPEKFPEKH